MFENYMFSKLQLINYWKYFCVRFFLHKYIIMIVKIVVVCEKIYELWILYWEGK
jgi:hypothetical protein